MSDPPIDRALGLELVAAVDAVPNECFRHVDATIDQASYAEMRTIFEFFKIDVLQFSQGQAARYN